MRLSREWFGESMPELAAQTTFHFAAPMAYALFIFISLVWGSNFILMKKAALSFGPVGIGAWRVFGGALVLALIWWWKEARWPFRKEHGRPLLLLVAVGYAGPFTVLPWLVERNGSAFMGMMISLVPVFTIAVSIPLLRSYPSKRQLAGVFGAMIFLGIIMADGLKRDIPILDLALAVSVPLCYAFANTHLKLRFPGIPALPLSCAALGLASVCLLPLAWTLPSERIDRNEHLAFAIVCLTVSSLLATGIATHIFYKLIQEIGPLFAGMTAYLIPLGAVVWGWADQEEVTLLQIVALFGILGMVAIVQTDLAASQTSRIRPPKD